ncbi:histone deacetylase [Aspergillus sclerotialis]|uniref:Histone deacetylase n=1 Tax=Aspergillus sclerotialis TaxID=2070753 RepID=A0A3A2ZW58_9EURO|nr:histone deacetylase [Aspergillus sclerotialis]
MEPSNPNDPPPSSIPSSPNPSSNLNDDALLSENLKRLSLSSITSVNPPTSPTGPPPSLLSHSEAPSRSVSATHQQTALRHTPSSSSLRDARRKSTPNLKKRSSTASMRSVHNSGGSTSPRPSLSRRPSSTFGASPTTMFPKRPSLTPSLTPVADDKTPSAADIAAEYFKKEVDLHQAVDLQSKTLVVVHDACYGHRFSRPRTSRAGLESIVERPERIRAGVLGVSAAYVRLGRRHSGERFAPHPDLDVHLLPAPPFQIRKTARSMALSSPAVTHVHGTKWMGDLRSMCDAAESRLALNGKELVRPQGTGKDESNASAAPLHEGDLYLCSESLNAFEGALGGVCEGVDAAFGTNSIKRVFVCIRPPGHHCSASHPSGFCWINNVHVGISYAAMTHGLTHAAILDFDLHHGDGSQEIAWDQNRKATNAPKNAANHKKTMIGYFSLHDINSYPCEMGDPEKVRNASVCIDKAHGQSIWNVHLEPWKTTSEFWDLYATRYALLIEKARAFLRYHTERLASSPNGPPPKAAVFISAGFDASEWEGSGMQRHKVNVPTDFYAKFTADVVQMANEEGLGADGRVVSVLEGGYSDRALTSGILSHLAGLGEATSSHEDANEQSSRLKCEMIERLGLSTPPPFACEPTLGADFNTDWWSPNFLEELEALVYPPPAPVKPREKTGPTYSAPTQSFAAKVVATTRDRKSIGSQADSDVPPPLPEVGWATAVLELSKVLIPKDRQTMSCRPEELKADPSRARRERQAALDNIGAGAGLEDSRMRLRVRKPKTSVPNTPKQQASKGNRRSTIDPASDLQKSLGLRDRQKIATPPASDAGDFDGAADQRTPSRASTGRSGQASRSGTSSSRSSTADTRLSATRSGTPKRTSSPKKAPPVPKVPPTFLTDGPADERPQDEMDNLTADVRKLNIKLKVPSPEEYAAREKKAAEQRKSPTKTSRSPKKGAKTPRATRPGLASRSRSSPTKSQVSSFPTTPVEAVAGLKHENPLESSSRPLTPPLPETEVSSTTTTTAEPELGSRTTESLTTLTPEAGSSPLTGFSPEAVAQPTVHTPSKFAVPDKHSLPIFTSKSAIPFAPVSVTDSSNDQVQSENRPSTAEHAASEKDNGY